MPGVPTAAAAAGWMRDAVPAECRRTFTTGCQRGMQPAALVN
jgi:hypothetical protein